MSTYAIISVGGKQYRVREGEKLLVDRLAHGEGNSFTPTVLLVGGDGETHIAPKDIAVTARLVANVKGEKIRIGKYRPKNGYKKHTGFRASLSQIEIQSIGGGKKRAAKAEDEDRGSCHREDERGCGSGRARRGSGQGHALRLRRADGRRHQGAVLQLDAPDARGSA